MPSAQMKARRRAAMACAAVLTASLASANAARAEIIPLADMLRGIEMTAAQCAAKPDAVWVTAFNRSFCIRYYMSTAGGSGSKPIVILSGDKLGPYTYSTRSFAPGPDDKDVDTANLMKRADAHSRSAGTTAIYLARIGIDGSSGFHGVRKTQLELHVLNAALDALKRRYRFEGFHLVGQSGGAGLVAALLALRNDIGCAVPGAGPMRWINHHQPADPALHMAEATAMIPAIARNRGARLLLVTDPADHYVQIEQQLPFVRSLRQAGGRVDQLFVQAVDPTHHFVGSYAMLTVTECVHGTPTPDIAVKLTVLQEKLLARAAAQAKANSAAPQAPASELSSNPGRKQ
jgi:hypothetical protein